jgi:hypothetical protein
MTDLQNKMLTKIALNDMTSVNGRRPETLGDVGDVWADCVIENAEDKGTFTSLLNAEMVNIFTYKNKRDNTVTLTQAGLDAFLAL